MRSHDRSLLKELSVFFLISLGVFVVDQASKQWVISNFVLYQTRTVLEGFFSLTFVINKGVAFGFMAGADEWRHVFFQAVAILSMAAMVYLYVTTSEKTFFFKAGMPLVFGGAAGNLSDRIVYKYVIDFLDFYFGVYHWPAFNIADSAITVGVCCLVWHYFNEPIKK